MTFEEYDVMHERSEMYKVRTIKAILVMTGNSDYTPNNLFSYISQCGEDLLSYHINVQDGGRYFEGTMKISELEDYLSKEN